MPMGKRSFGKTKPMKKGMSSNRPRTRKASSRSMTKRKPTVQPKQKGSGARPVAKKKKRTSARKPTPGMLGSGLAAKAAKAAKRRNQRLKNL